MKRILVTGEMAARSEVIEALRRLDYQVELVDQIRGQAIKIINFDEGVLAECLLTEGSDRHMKNSPYPEKRRGKGKRNKY